MTETISSIPENPDNPRKTDETKLLAEEILRIAEKAKEQGRLNTGQLLERLALCILHGDGAEAAFGAAALEATDETKDWLFSHIYRELKTRIPHAMPGTIADGTRRLAALEKIENEEAL